MNQNIPSQDREIVYEKQNMFEVIYNPVNYFHKLKNNPIILKPLLFVIFLQVILSYLNFNIEKEPDIGQAGWLLMSLFAGVSNTILLLLTALLFLFFLYLVKNKIRYKVVLSVVVHVMIILVMGMAVSVILSSLFGGPMHYYTSPLMLFEEDDFLYNLSTGLDIFTVWMFIAMGTGLKIVSGITGKKAFAFVFILYLFSALSAIFTT